MMTEQEVSKTAMCILTQMKWKIDVRNTSEVYDDIVECVRQIWFERDYAGFEMAVLKYLGMTDCIQLESENEVLEIAKSRIGLIQAALSEINTLIAHSLPQPRY